MLFALLLAYVYYAAVLPLKKYSFQSSSVVTFEKLLFAFSKKEICNFRLLRVNLNRST